MIKYVLNKQNTPLNSHYVTLTASAYFSLHEVVPLKPLS